MKVVVFGLVAFALAAASAAPLVDEQVHADIAAKGVATVILHFGGPRTSEVLAKFHADYKPLERSVHHDILPNLLEANANRHQAATLDFLRSRAMAKSSGGDHTQLWMLNQIAVHDADAELIATLSSMDDIVRIEANKEYNLLAPVVPDQGEIFGRPIEAKQSNKGEPQWGVAAVGAPEMWQKNVTGLGVVVGVIDTGARSSHEVLRRNYRTNYGWYDAIFRLPWAYDDNGHGSHCAGSILGGQGYGVAPNATLLACKALSFAGAGSDVSLRTCGQFMLCPTNGLGKNKKCELKPKIISNSWGSNQVSDWYNDVTDAWIANGQVAIFANGNAGSDCSTVGSPAAYDKAIAVGATNSTNQVAWFSSRGPVPDKGNMKPDVSAPGQDITSAGYLYDTHYQTMSGTSMATPHVAGVAALIVQQNPEASHDDVMKALIKSAKPVEAVGQTCGGGADDTYPNNVVGAGLVYAPAAM